MLRMPEPIVRHCEPDQDVFEDFGDKKEAGNTINNNNFHCIQKQIPDIQSLSLKILFLEFFLHHLLGSEPCVLSAVDT